MRIAVATGCFWFRPFDEALAIIRDAGAEFVEVDIYWSRFGFARGQHLANVPAVQGLAMIEASGLRATNVHNVGGVAGSVDEDSSEVFDPVVFDWMAPAEPRKLLVFHLPRVFSSDPRPDWWRSYEAGWVEGINRFRRPDTIVTVENLQPVQGLYDPVFAPSEIESFCHTHELGVTFDVSQCLWAGFDLYKTALRLRPLIQNCHLGEHKPPKRPRAIIDGKSVDWERFLSCLDRDVVSSVTVECSMSSEERKDVDMSRSELTERLAGALNLIRNALPS